MDARFREMLLEAEKIRAEFRGTGNSGPHLEHTSDMTDYAIERDLLTGSMAESTASEENLALGVEMAAGVLEITHGEQIGSIVDLSVEEKLRVFAMAKNATELSIFRGFCEKDDMASNGESHIPNTDEITQALDCKQCLIEVAEQGKAIRRMIRVGWTKLGIQVWCTRHNCNIAHIDFEGHQHPASITAGIDGKELTEEHKMILQAMRHSAAADIGCSDVFFTDE